MQIATVTKGRWAAAAAGGAGGMPHRRRAARWWPRIAVVLAAASAALPLHAAGIACPEMPSAVTAVNRDVKADISANVGALGRLKAGELALKTETVAKNLFDKYPNVDRLLTVQTMAATYCSMLNTAAIGDLERLQRWEVFQSKVLNFSDGGGGAATKAPAKKPAEPPKQPRRRPDASADDAKGGIQATVVQLLSAPKTGPLDEMEQWFLPYIGEWFKKTQIVIDIGASGGIREGDYFHTVDDEVKVTSRDRQPLGLIVTPGSELHAVSVAERYTICQLDNWAYGSFFERLRARLDSLSGGGAAGSEAGNRELSKSEEAVLLQALAPLAVGDKVRLIPQAERNAWSELSEAYTKAVHQTPAADEKRFRMTVAIERADLFMRQHPAGYFTPAALFNKGYLQFELGQYRDATATFNDFLKRYPFHLSAPGATSWIDKMKESAAGAGATAAAGAAVAGGTAAGAGAAGAAAPKSAASAAP